MAVIFVTGKPIILEDKYIGGGNGTAGLAASSTAGAAVANPQIIGTMVPELKSMADSATAITATACLLTAILVPILTAMWARKYGRRPQASVAAPTPPTSAAGSPPKLAQGGHF